MQRRQENRQLTVTPASAPSVVCPQALWTTWRRKVRAWDGGLSRGFPVRLLEPLEGKRRIQVLSSPVGAQGLAASFGQLLHHIERDVGLGVWPVCTLLPWRNGRLGAMHGDHEGEVCWRWPPAVLRCLNKKSPSYMSGCSGGCDGGYRGCWGIEGDDNPWMLFGILCYNPGGVATRSLLVSTTPIRKGE